MMNAIKYMDELEQKGFTKEQAKTSVNLWIELMNENLASKNDLKDAVHKIDKEFLALRHEMKEMESRITMKLGGIVATSIAIAVSLTAILR